jgi:hypothetical protein
MEVMPMVDGGYDCGMLFVAREGEKLAERCEGCWRFAWEKLGEKGKGWVR